MGGMTFTPILFNWRFYNDGAEATSTPIDAENTTSDMAVAADKIFQFRCTIQETGGGNGGSSDSYTLEFNRNSAGWTSIGTASTYIEVSGSGGQLTDNSLTTNRTQDGLTNPGSGSFAAVGKQEETLNVITNVRLTSNDYMECVWGLNAVELDLADGDSIQFRVLLNGSTVLSDTTPGTPTLTIAKFLPNISAYRFYEDDGDEANSTAIAAQSVNITRNPIDTRDPDLHLRIQVEENGGVSGDNTDDFKLQYSKNSGAWNDVTSTSSNVQGLSTANLSQGGNTTDRATDGISSPGKGNFVIGEQVEGLGQVTNRQLTAGNFTEHVFALTLINADLADNDTLDFRLQSNHDGTFAAISQTPTNIRITIDKIFTPKVTGFRWYEDNGTELTSSPSATEDANDLMIPSVVNTDKNYHLRVQIQEQAAIAGAATDDWQLQYSRNSGAWTNVTASSSFVKAATDSQLTDGSATTNRATNGITDPGGTFLAGVQEEGDGLILNHQLTASNFTEHVWAIKFVWDEVVDGDIYDFRVTQNNSGSFVATDSEFHALPMRTTVSDTFDPVMTGWRFYEDDGTESTSTPIDAEDTNITRDDTLAAERTMHLRVQIQNQSVANGLTTDDWQFRYSKNSGAFTAITTASSNIKLQGSGSQLTHGSATTNRSTNGITDPSNGSFVAGEQAETDDILDHQLTAADYTEHVVALELIDADLVDSDTLDIKLYHNGTVVSGVGPRITISGGGTTTPQSLSTTTANTAALSTVKIKVQSLSVTTADTAALATVATFPRSLTTTTANTAALSTVSTFVRSLATTTANVAALASSKFFTQALAATTALVANLSTIKTKVQSLAATTANVAALSTVKTGVVNMAATTANVAALATSKIVAQALAATTALTASLSTVASYFRSLSVTTANVAAMSQGKLILQALATTTANVAALATVKIGVVGMAISTANTAALSTVSTFFRTLSTSTANVATLADAFIKPISMSTTTALVAALDATQLILQSLAATTANTAALSTSTIKAVSMAATTALVAALSTVKIGVVNMAVSTANVAALSTVASYFRSMAVTTANVADMALGKFFTQALATVTAVSASLSTAVTFAQLLAVSTANVAALAKSATFFRVLSTTTALTAGLSTVKTGVVSMAVSTANVAALVADKTFTQALAVTTAVTAAMSQVPTYSQLLVTSTANVASWVRKISLNFATTATGTAGMIANKLGSGPVIGTALSTWIRRRRRK